MSGNIVGIINSGVIFRRSYIPAKGITMVFVADTVTPHYSIKEETW